MNHELQAIVDKADAVILAGTRKIAARCLALGIRSEDLNTVLRPWLRYIAVWRAHHIEPIEAMVERGERPLN